MGENEHRASNIPLEIRSPSAPLGERIKKPEGKKQRFGKKSNEALPVFFAHANGFPSPCYQQLFSALAPQFNIEYIESLGHNPKYPVTENWDYLVEEIIDTLKAHPTPEPVIGVGHSLGGVLLFFAASRYPELFRHVVLLDAPIFPKTRSLAIWFVRRLGLIEYFTPGKGQTRYRKRFWPDYDSAMQYLKSRKLFEYFQENCLNDYIHFGMGKTANGLGLKFEPEIEHRIFNAFPHNMNQYAAHMRVPTTLLYGAQTDFVKPKVRKHMKKILPQFRNYRVPGTHMFPFEHPQETAEAIKQIFIREFST